MKPDSLTDRGTIRVLIIAGQDPVSDWMANVITANKDLHFVGLVRDSDLLLESIQKLEPDILLIDVNSGILQQGNLLAQVAAPISRQAVIMVAMMGEVEAVQKAMLHGAQGFLLKPFREEELIGSIHKTYELLLQRRAEMPDVPRLLAGEQVRPRPQAQIISVYSPKGGVGCTTVAINLAVSLHTISQKPVILVDGDLRFGDIDIALNITSGASISSLLPDLDDLDDSTLESALGIHSSGIRVLTAPPLVDAAEAIRPEHLSRLLNRLARLHEGYIVVDAWSVLDDCTLAILDASSRLVMLTTPQVTALRDTHRCLDALKLLKYDVEKTLLVLNQCYHRSTIKIRDVEQALGYRIAQTIEYAPGEVTGSLNRGVPLVLEYSDSPAAQNILELARTLSGKGVPSLEPMTRAEPEPVANRKKRRGIFSFRSLASANEVDS